MGFTITSQNGPNFSIFDCQGNSTVFYLSSSNFYIYNVTMKNCYKGQTGDPNALTSGGAISVIYSLIYLENLIIYNSYAYYGGAFSCIDSTCYVSSCNFSMNSAGMDGGAIYNKYSTFNVGSNTTIQSNSAGVTGGGIYSEASTFTVVGQNINFNDNFLQSSNSLSQISCSDESRGRKKREAFPGERPLTAPVS